MASSINASTSGAGGVITTADNSGILNLQSGGTTVATVSSTGFSTPANQTINTANTFGFKNRIINGDFKISQYNGTSSYTQTGNTYGIDRWIYQVAAASGVFSQQQLSASPPAGFGTYLTITNASVQTISASSRNAISQSIEGNNFYDLGFGTANAKTVTLSAWVKSSIAGTHGGSLQNYAQTRSYPFTFSIPVANTWTYITVTIPGDTSGTWVGATNSGAANLLFGLGAGSTYSGTAGSWASADYRTATGATTGMATTSGATYSITGVQLEVGSQATSYDFRSITTELALCQRYYQTMYARSLFVSNSYIGQVFQTSVPMRTSPTITFTDTGGNANKVTVQGTNNYAVAAGNVTGGVFANYESYILVDIIISGAPSVYSWWAVYVYASSEL